MSGYALMLSGRSLRALVVGGGAVATRKVQAILPHVAHARVVAPAPSAALEGLARERPDALSIEWRAYEPADIGDAELVFAATDRRDVNARVAADARALRRLVNVADGGDEGTFTTPAQRGMPPLHVAVSTGVPEISRRLLDRIVARFDARYARAATEVAALRSALLRDGARDDWERARDQLLGDDFCDSVEDGRFDARLAAWR